MNQVDVAINYKYGYPQKKPSCLCSLAQMDTMIAYVPIPKEYA
jgi:hypothetical protein